MKKNVLTTLSGEKQVRLGGDNNPHQRDAIIEVTGVHLLQRTCSCASKGFSIRCPAHADEITPEQVLDGKD